MATYYDVGDALKAERVAARARKGGRVQVTQGSSRHRIQTSKLEGDVYCVIEKPLRSVRTK